MTGSKALIVSIWPTSGNLKKINFIRIFRKFIILIQFTSNLHEVKSKSGLECRKRLVACLDRFLERYLIECLCRTLHVVVVLDRWHSSNKDHEYLADASETKARRKVAEIMLMSLGRLTNFSISL